MSSFVQVGALGHSIAHAVRAVQGASPSPSSATAPPGLPNVPGVPPKRGAATEVITWIASVLLVCGLLSLMVSAWKTVASRRAQGADPDGAARRVPWVLLGASVAAVVAGLIGIAVAG